MKVPLTVNDFLRRAELLYPDRIGDRRRAGPAGRVVGHDHLPRDGRAGAGDGRRPRRARHRRRRAGGDGQPQLGAAAHRAVRRVRARAASSCRSTSASSPRRSGTSSSTPAPGCCSSTPSSTTRWPTSSASARCVDRRRGRRRAAALRRRAGAVGRPTRTPPRRSTTRRGTTARPKGVQLTHRNLWLNATTFGWHMGVSDRDVYLHTLPQFHCNGWGMLYAVTGMGGEHVILRKVDGAEILRRVEQHGVTLMCGAPAVVNMVLDAAATWDGRDPRPRPGAHRRRRRAAADAHDRAGRDRARLGVHPDLRPHRDVAAADDEPHPRRVRRPRRRPSGPSSSTAPARPAIGCDDGASTTRARCWPAATWSWRATGSSPRPPPTRSSTAGSTPATAARSTTTATSRSPTARRT